MSIKWNGRNFEDALNKAAFAETRDNVAKRLRAIRCPEHGRPPASVRVTGHNLKTLKWEVHGCCDRLVDAATRALG